MASPSAPPSSASPGSVRVLTLAAASLVLVDVVHGLLTGRYAFPESALHLAVLCGAAVQLLRGGGAIAQLIALAAAAAAQVPWGVPIGADLLSPGVLLPLLCVCACVAALRLLVRELSGLLSPAVTISSRVAPAADAAPGAREEPKHPAGIVPGWYADPLEPSWLRWWDGEQWTESRRRVAS